MLKIVPLLGLLHPTHIDHHMRFLSLRTLSSGHQYALGFSVFLGMQPASDAAFLRMSLSVSNLLLTDSLMFWSPLAGSERFPNADSLSEVIWRYLSFFNVFDHFG